jgi:hypothetical protein
MKFEGMGISSVSVLETGTKENSGYAVNLSLTINTTAEYSKRNGDYDNPDLDLSEDLGLYAFVIYSKNLGETFTDPSKSLTSDNTFYRKVKLTQEVRDQNGKLKKELITTNIEDGSPLPDKIDIKYTFEFSEDLSNFYEPNDPINLKVVVVPYQTYLGNSPDPVSELGESIFYDQLSANVLQDGEIRSEGIKDLRKRYYEEIFNLDLFSQTYPAKSVSSDLFASFGKKNQVKGMFVFNKIDLIKNNSFFGNLLYNKGMTGNELASLMSYTNIENIKIIREKMKDSNAIYQNFPPKVIISTREQDGSLRLGTKRKVQNNSSSEILAQISELKLANNDPYLKFVCFNDYDSINTGTYQYSMELTMKDGATSYLQDKLTILEDATKALNQYYGEKYILKKDTTLESSELSSEVSNVYETLIVLSDVAFDKVFLKANLENLVKYQESFLNMLEFVGNTTKQLQDIVGISQANLQKTKSFSTGNNNKNILTYKTVFSDLVDLTLLRNIEYDYIGIPKNSNIGISLISQEDLQRRFDFEFDKLISDDQDGNFDDLSNKMFTDTEGRGPISDVERSYFNLQSKYYSYLSPVQIGKEKITKQNVFDNVLYNNFRLTDPSNHVLGAKMALSYLMLDEGIILGGLSYDGTTKKVEKSKGSTYFNSNEVFSEQDEMNTGSVPVPSPIEKDFDGPTDTREKYTSFVNSVLKEKDGWTLTKESFNQVSLGRSYYEDMPNHIRVLFGGKSDACRNKWLLTDGDYFQNPDTYYMIKQNYMNLATIQVLGFANGDLKRETFRDLTKEDIEGGNYLICRMLLGSKKNLQIGEGFEERNYTNKYFIMIPSSQDSSGTTTIEPFGGVAIGELTGPDDGGFNGFEAKEVPDYVINPNFINP